MTSFLEKFQCACTLSAVGKGGSPAPAVSTCTGGGGGTAALSSRRMEVTSGMVTCPASHRENVPEVTGLLSPVLPFLLYLP